MRTKQADAQIVNEAEGSSLTPLAGSGMTSATIPMKWAEDVSNGGCVCCGRKLRPSKLLYHVEVIHGGADVAHPGLGPATDDPGYMGLHRVGPTCAKKHFAGYYHVSPNKY